MKRLFALLGLCLMLVAGTARAETVEITFGGCVDPDGQPVASVADPALGTTVATRIESGRPVIRYNAQVLPELQAQTRLFLFAHECARINLGLPLSQPLTVEEARRADCWGVTTLMRSRLMTAASAARVQADLDAVDKPALLPGPSRRFDLPACVREDASRPSLAHPSAGQPQWNTCTHACGEQLRSCKRTCKGAACEACTERFDRCTSVCDFRYAP